MKNSFRTLLLLSVLLASSVSASLHEDASVVMVHGDATVLPVAVEEMKHLNPHSGGGQRNARRNQSRRSKRSPAVAEKFRSQCMTEEESRSRARRSCGGARRW